jgi:hypothetical protein
MSDTAMIMEEMAVMKDLIANLTSDMNKRFNEQDKRFDKQDKRFDELDKRFNKQDKRFDELGGTLRQLAATTLAPEGDEVAKTVTVAIKNEGITEGHGLFYTIRGEGGDRYFILSAAHVVVHFVPEKNIKIEWKPWDNIVHFELKLKDLFLKEDYIKTGGSDVGLAEVEFVNPLDVERLTVKKIQQAPHDVEVGQTMVGHSTVYLRGTFLSPCEGQSARRLVNTPSMPGVSGCPLFDSNARLFAVVHGCSKHRHSHGDDDVSPYLYADVPYSAAGLRKVSSEVSHREMLQYGERLDLDLAKESSKEYIIGADNCPTFITGLADLLPNPDQPRSKHSVDSLMGQLAKICLQPDDESSDEFIIPEIMSCLIPKTAPRPSQNAGGASCVSP